MSGPGREAKFIGLFPDDRFARERGPGISCSLVYWSVTSLRLRRSAAQGADGKSTPLIPWPPPFADGLGRQAPQGDRIQLVGYSPGGRPAPQGAGSKIPAPDPVAIPLAAGVIFIERDATAGPGVRLRE